MSWAASGGGKDRLLVAEGPASVGSWLWGPVTAMCASQDLALASHAPLSAALAHHMLWLAPRCSGTRHHGASSRFPRAYPAADDAAVAKAPSKRKIRISMWLPPDLHERLERAAEADHRTKTAFTIVALKRALDEFEASEVVRKK